MRSLSATRDPVALYHGQHIHLLSPTLTSILDKQLAAQLLYFVTNLTECHKLAESIAIPHS